MKIPHENNRDIPQIPNFRDAVTFWKQQCDKMTVRNMALYGELALAENKGFKWMVIAFIFAVLFITTLGAWLL